MFTPVTWRLHLKRSPLKRLSSPIEASKRFRCRMREGLRSLSPVPGAGILSSVEPYSDARHGEGNGVVGVALTPPHVRPASNCSSAVRPLRLTAGCPLSVVEVSAHAVFGLLESGL